VNLLGWIGVWLLVAGAVAILTEVVLIVVWGRAVANRSHALQARIEAEQGMIEVELKRLQDAVVEMRRLWKPYRRVIRWLRHPLTIALLESYALRRARR
jgi:hypothetical protein